MRRYALRDDQWDRIKDILPGSEGHGSILPAMNEFELLGVGILTQSNRTPHSERSTRFPLSNHASALGLQIPQLGHELWGLCNDHLLFHQSHDAGLIFCSLSRRDNVQGGAA
jgi:hypothetical protein